VPIQIEPDHVTTRRGIDDLVRMMTNMIMVEEFCNSLDSNLDLFVVNNGVLDFSLSDRISSWAEPRFPTVSRLLSIPPGGAASDASLAGDVVQPRDPNNRRVQLFYVYPVGIQVKVDHVAAFQVGVPTQHAMDDGDEDMYLGCAASPEHCHDRPVARRTESTYFIRDAEEEFRMVI
jgi:hypothetical protein